MNIKPHTMNDLDRYGPMAKLPLPLSSPVWDELARYTHPVGCPSYAAFQHVADAEFPA